MTEELESAQEVQEAADKPSPSVPSAVSGVEQASAPSVDVDKIVDALMPKIEERISRSVQSVKDRRIAGLTDDVERLKSYIKQTGGDVDRAVREMEVDDILRERRSSKEVPGRTESDGAEVAFEAISTELLSGAGIAFDDAEYNAFVQQWHGKIRNPAHWGDVLRAHIERRQSKATKQGSVTPAAVASTPGAPAQPADTDADIAAIAKQLRELHAGKHGPPTSPQIQEKISALESKLDEIEPMVDLNDPNVRIDTSAVEEWNIT
jgi:hypothetical protein